MRSSPAIEPDMVDALTCVRWKRHQDALVELSEHGIVLIVEESGCLQARVQIQVFEGNNRKYPGKCCEIKQGKQTDNRKRRNVESSALSFGC